MQSACSYLKSQYNPKLGLVKSRGLSNVAYYYIAPDNLLIANAISSCDPTTSNAINQSIISCCDNGHDHMHEALFGAKIPLPITYPLTYTLADSMRGSLFRGVTATSAGGNYTVVWEVHNSTGAIPDCTYADTTVYAALELKMEGNTSRTQSEMDCLNTMFDGRGMVDETYKTGSFIQPGIYQTANVALYIYAIQKVQGGYFYGEESNLFRMQGPDGGFHSGYDQAGTYAGTPENVETTAIAMIAMSSLTSTSPFPFPLFSIPTWIVYFFAAWAAIAVGVVVIVLLFERRKEKKSFQSKN